MDKRTFVLGATSALLFTAAAALFFRNSAGRPKIQLGPYQALGSVTADETIKLVGSGGRVVLVFRDPGVEGDPVTDAELAAFRQKLREDGKVTIGEEVPIRMDAMLGMATGGAVPPQELMQVVNKNPGISAVVLFLAFPGLAPAELEALKKNGARMIVVSALLPGYKTWLKNETISLAIVPRSNALDLGQAPRTLREWFDQEYVVVTAETADQLPY